MLLHLPLLLLPPFLNIVIGGHLQAENQIKVEEQQAIDCCHRYQRKHRSNQCAPIADNTLPELLVVLSLHEDPNALTYHSNAEESNSHEKPYKLCIIFATDTVIQVLAVMVKLLDASLASLAVMAAKVHSAPALPTVD